MFPISVSETKWTFMSFVLTSSITHRACLLHIYRAQLYVLTFRFDFHTTFRCSRDKHVRIPHAVSWYQIHHRLRFCCDSFFICIFLRSFRHRFKTIAGTEMADVEQTQKMIPFITCEISLCQYVCELVLGVDVFDLDLRIKINSIEQPIKSNSVGSGDMSRVTWRDGQSSMPECQMMQGGTSRSWKTVTAL